MVPRKSRDTNSCSGGRVDFFCTILFVRPLLTLSEPQSRFGDKLLEISLVCPQNVTAVLKGSSRGTHCNMVQPLVQQVLPGSTRRWIPG